MALNVALIKELRDRTGAGMTDCKKALEETNNNLEAACDWLREKGIAKAAKKSSRIAAEGTTLALANGDDAIIVEVNSETDFVAKSDAFKALVNEVAELLLSKKPASLEEGKALTADLFTSATVKIAAEAIANETAIQMEASKTDEKLKGKPANVLENIIKGKVSKYFAESVLVEQDYLLEPGTKVGAYLKKNNLNVNTFIRYETGEGIAKRVENFAEEVQKQMQ